MPFKTKFRRRQQDPAVLMDAAVEAFLEETTPKPVEPPLSDPEVQTVSEQVEETAEEAASPPEAWFLRGVDTNEPVNPAGIDPWVLERGAELLYGVHMRSGGRRTEAQKVGWYDLPGEKRELYREDFKARLRGTDNGSLLVYLAKHLYFYLDAAKKEIFRSGEKPVLPD